MMNMMPWRKSSNPENLPAVKQEDVTDAGEIIVVQQNSLVPKKNNSNIVLVRKKAITVDGKKFDMDPQAMMRMIKQITQTIGEYKGMDNPMSSYVITGLRKVRQSMTADLHHHFGINWQLGDDGVSQFYM